MRRRFGNSNNQVTKAPRLASVGGTDTPISVYLLLHTPHKIRNPSSETEQFRRLQWPRAGGEKATRRADQSCSHQLDPTTKSMNIPMRKSTFRFTSTSKTGDGRLVSQRITGRLSGVRVCGVNRRWRLDGGLGGCYNVRLG